MTAAPCVADTSAWIEWLADTALGQRPGQRLPDEPQCIVPTLVQLELSKWLGHEIGEDATDLVIASTLKYVVVPLDTAIARLAADWHREYSPATADAFVYATAGRQGAGLPACARHFKGLSQENPGNSPC